MQRLKVPQSILDAKPNGLEIWLYRTSGMFVSGKYSVYKRNKNIFSGDETEVLEFLKEYKEVPPSFWNKPDKNPPKGEDFGAFTRSIPVLVATATQMYVGYQQIDTEENATSWRMAGPDGYVIKDVASWSFLPPLPKQAAV